MPQVYNQTLNLPKTDFPMRAGLPQREPVMLEKWENEGLYYKMAGRNAKKPPYHEGHPSICGRCASIAGVGNR